MTKKLPRGIRNNNPFNIKRTAVSWFGECKGHDKVFETFQSLELGIRAGMKLLMNYISHGYDTPRKIITRFAPFSENDTQNYLDFVCLYTSLSPDERIFVSTDKFLELCSAIIRFENGFDVYDMSEYRFTASDLHVIFKKYNV